MDLLHLSFFYFNVYLYLLFRCYFEIGGEFQYDTVPTPEQLSEMLQKSPITHVKKVRSYKKILFLVFSRERVSLFNSGKVPPSPSLSMFKGKDLGERLRLSLPENVCIFFAQKQ